MAALPATLARITPAVRAVQSAPPPVPAAPRTLTSREKAAIIVRLMLAQGQKLPITSLPEHMQSALAEQMAHMRLVDRGTMTAVVQEFLGALEDVGLTFPGGIEGALALMDGHISGTAAGWPAPRPSPIPGTMSPPWTMNACCRCWRRKASKSPR